MNKMDKILHERSLWVLNSEPLYKAYVKFCDKQGADYENRFALKDFCRKFATEIDAYIRGD